MNIDKDRAETRAQTSCGDFVIGADLRESNGASKVERVLGAFREVLEQRPNARLVLATKRSQSGKFSVLNWIEKNGLSDRVSFHPYYRVCNDFPVKKRDCACWVDDRTEESDLTASGLIRLAEEERPKKIALFVTSFHPAKHEGNSALMRQWLSHLRGAGYRVHLLYYSLDKSAVPDHLVAGGGGSYELFVEVAVDTQLVGVNQNGLNVHVDDWCGVELLEASAELVARHSYDVAIVNYAFMSAVFETLPPYTERILLTHDSFADRNRRMLADGFPEAGWVSIDTAGEALACRRADAIVALQDQEADYFRKLTGRNEDVLVIGPIAKGATRFRGQAASPIAVGNLGSSNWVNEINLTEFLKLWVQSDLLQSKAKLVIGGGMSGTLDKFAPAALLSRAAPRIFGSVERLSSFFEECDLFINPERGGTGIKIKTLEAMAHGVPVLATKAGAVGIGSTSRFHAAEDMAGLIKLVEEVAANPELVEHVARDTRTAYEAYVVRHRNAMAALLGPSVNARRHHPSRKAPYQPPTPAPFIPEYVRVNGAKYHIEEFQRIWQRVSVAGKRVLEVGSDFHLASARLFIANGATEVVATNLGAWKSDEPLPPGLSFVCGDVSTIADDSKDIGSFDIIYGIAVLEHIPDLDSVAQAVRRLLKPGGLAYFQGCPLWAGALGHHVWISRADLARSGGITASESSEGLETVYSFTDSSKNPIPNWAHVVLDAEKLTELLIGRAISQTHAEAITNYVYNCDGNQVGVASNFKAASEIITAFLPYLHVEAIRDEFSEPKSEFYRAALLKYSDEDLSTLGLRLWLTTKETIGSYDEAATPTVSLVVPFYGVEEYIEACLHSILEQEFEDFEVILVDDASRDGSRAIAERIAATDDRIRIVTHPLNRGLGPARNTGVEHAAGEFLLFLDSDDVLASPAALGILVAAARRTGCNLVAGSCEWLLPGGRREPFDRVQDGRFGGRPGEIVRGKDAFVATMCVPGCGYLPMRAWGTLIDRSYYNSLGHRFPSGEHEDLAHTPILYFRADGVYYETQTIVLYRKRETGLSRLQWSAEKLSRYQALWMAMAESLRQHGPEDETGDSALKFAEHLLWKLESNGLKDDAEEAFFETMEVLVRASVGATNGRLATVLLNQLQAPSFLPASSRTRLRSIVNQLPARMLIEFYRRKLESLGGVMPFDPVREPTKRSQEPEPATPAAPTRIENRLTYEANDALAQRILAEYEAVASKTAKDFPSMLTRLDKAIYFHAAKNFGFRGSIVDAGCFVGGTTINLVEGLKHNPDLAADPSKGAGLIRVYDLFQIDDDYILDHLERNYPDRDFRGQMSFLSVFKSNLASNAALLDVRPGDVIQAGYRDAQPIEVFGVDLCKALVVTDFVAREFFPRLLPGALVLQQDFIHEFHPHIHLSMLRLEEFFDPYVELKWGGTVAFKVRKPITPGDIVARFGKDSSWYGDTAHNVALLRRLIDEAHYDENRWIYLLTLGIYLAAHGAQQAARAAYSEATTRFPAFEASARTREMLGV